MNSFPDAIRFLYALQKKGMKFGLQGILSLLRTVGNPHLQFPCIHIAGTNGKGSTASMLAAVLTAAGYKTGLYTSPHLVSFEERIRIDGRPIPRSAVARLTNLLKRPIEKNNVTFFEATTALAFKYFVEKKVDIAVVETGLGGRLDSTNVVKPLATVITTIGLDHTDILGPSTQRIAWEKAGIIKRGVPCITGVESRTSLRVIRRVCRSKSAPLVLAKTARVRVRRLSLDGSVVDVSLRGRRHANLDISLSGTHQIRNAATALVTLREVGERSRFSVTETALRDGLSNVQENSGLLARLSVLSRRPCILADVAHNPAAMRELVHSLIELNIKDILLVFGVMRDKDYTSMIRILAPVVSSAVAVAPSTERARPSLDVAREFERKGIKTWNAGTVSGGVRQAKQLAKAGQSVVITGSHFVVGEAIAFLTRKKYLTINQ